MLRHSLTEDDDAYFKRKLEGRTEKCRVRTCVFAFTDIIYSGLGLIFCMTILGFHIRQDMKPGRLDGGSGPTSIHTNPNNLTTSSSSRDNDVNNYDTVKAIKRNEGADFFGVVNWTSPYVFYGIQLGCLLIKLIAAILLFVGNQKRRRPRSRRDSEGSFEEVQFTPNDSDEFPTAKSQPQPGTSAAASSSSNSASPLQNNNYYNDLDRYDSTTPATGSRKTRFGHCSCKTWIALNAIVLPFTVFKIVQFVFQKTPFYNKLLLIEAIVELVYRTFGLIFILDYLQFIRKRMSNRYFVSSVRYNDVPPSCVSCVFCKSWCMLFNECC